MLEDFFFSVLELKNIPRKGWSDKLNISKPESVADHSFATTIMSMILANEKNVNVEKIMKMSLLHDLAESKIGDLTPEEISKDEKTILENNAMKEILSQLPSNLFEEYQKIWGEFQEKKSKESILLHEIDKLEMAFQAKKYLNESNKEQIQLFFDSAKNEISDDTLIKLFKNII